MLARITEQTQQRTRTGCYSTCNKILNKTGFKDSKTKYQVVKESGRNIINLDTDYSKIDRQLREGIPVLVGVHHTFKYGYNEGTTDHFVIIIEKGYDENGLYYRFLDVGTRKGKDISLKFRYNIENLVYSGSRKTYTISQIRLIIKTQNYGRNRQGNS